jgi:release factor glutamine methyltransferase
LSRTEDLGALVEAGTPVRDAIAAAREMLLAAGVDDPRLDAELLLAAALGAERAALYTEPERKLDPEESRSFAEMLRRRLEREPVAYVLGRSSFRQLELSVDPRVLIPRPETELLVDLAQDRQRVLDVGTGSGAVALAIANEREGVQVCGIDNSPEAIDVARENARRTGLEVEFLIADLIVGGPYHLIVANLPYVRESEWEELQPEITRYEPRDALVAGPDGLDVIRDLIPASSDVLVRGGMLGVEVGQGQSRTVESLFERSGFTHVETIRDLAGIPRVVTGRHF